MSDHRPITVLLPGAMDPAWSSVPLFVEKYDGYLIFVSHPGYPVAPPVSNPALASADEAFLGILSDRLDDMNLAVATSASHARNVPDPAAPASNSRRFWRINADWSADSDGDGSPDWAEFQMASQSGHGSQAAANAFNSDTNGDGNIDQLDNDEDGIADAEDADLKTSLVDWERTPEPRFAVFPVARPIDEWGESESPFQVTDQGFAVFPYGIWRNGSYTEIRNSSSVMYCRIDGVSSFLGRIVGSGTYDHDGDGLPTLNCHVMWSDPASLPQPVGSGEDFALGAFPGIPNPRHFVGDDLGIIANVRNEDGSLTLERWILPWLPDSGFTHSPVPAWAHSSINSGLMWGYGNQAIINNTEVTLPSPPSKLIVTPGNSVIGLGMDDGFPMVYRGNGWAGGAKVFGKLAHFSRSGFGATFLPTGIWNNGKTVPVTAAAPGIPAGWNYGGIIDMSDFGNVLLVSANHNDYAFGTPICLEDNEPARGVDNISIGSTDPGEGVANKLWVMAPAGGTNSFKFVTNANPDCLLHLNLSAASLSTGVLSSNEQDVEISAALGASSQDVSIEIKNGTGTSLSSPVGVKVMKKRTVKVKVWPIKRQFGGQSAEPVYVPTKADLDGYLNNIFKDQINIEFNCDVATPVAIQFEESSPDPTDYGGPSGYSFPPDFGHGELNMADEFEGEAGAVANQADPSSHINIYLVGGVNQGRDVIWNPVHNTPATFPPWVGSTDVEGRRCWVVGGTAGQTSGLTKESILGTISHEIGHVLLGLGHPNEDKEQARGIAPLPGTDHVHRLMCSGEKRKKDGTSKLLVKAEWDEADKRMSRFIPAN
ncbi:hypothetical protein [Luteolibacter sp. Populi]|uniref:hypothetical protein n=1 Tax=Luteolibacter sp. Populi TaxID=3230487 RepID=UPI0034665B5C